MVDGKPNYARRDEADPMCIDGVEQQRQGVTLIMLRSGTRAEPPYLNVGCMGYIHSHNP